MINENNIRKDSIYSKLYEKYGEEYVVKAGYFENDSQDNCFSDEELIESLKFLSTPLPDKSQINERSVILLNTGCFNPIHDGHIQMMETAKDFLQNKGLVVVKAYFAPDADSYVSVKSSDYMNIHQRIADIKNTLKDNTHYEWLTIEPWAGLYAKKDVNFTTIYRRLQLYIQKYLGVDIPIYYVCGSDRGEFSFTFEDKTIVVNRLSSERDEKGFLRLYPIVTDVHPAAHQITPYLSSMESSSNVRTTWVNEPPKQRELILRVDNDSFSLNQGYRQGLTQILKKYFSKLHFNYEVNQRAKFEIMKKNTISIDSLLYDKYKLEISRYYDLGGFNFICYSSRIGHDDLSRQIKKIPKNIDLYLFDDDTFTGGTFKYARKFLKDHRILGEITLVKSNTDLFEVLDLRDFFLGDNCGLAILTPDGAKFRAPYVYPFVDPFIRASVIDPIKFSKEVWKFNYEFFRDTDITIEGREFDCFKYIGFSEKTKVRDVCKYFMENL